jgi:hypothetical protein
MPLLHEWPQNSFIIRGWSIALVSAVLAVSVKDLVSGAGFLALFPVLGFWYLDAFYLRQERLFRALYGEVAKGNVDVPAFSMDTSIFAGQAKCRWWTVLLSPTILALHLPLLLAVLAVSFTAVIIAMLR